MQHRSFAVPLSVLLAGLFSDVAIAQSSAECNAPSAVAAVQEGLIKRGLKDPDWVFRLGLNVPSFRMKDVSFLVKNIRRIGPWRKGAECEIILQMTTPVDVMNPNSIIATVHYVVSPTPDGGIEAEIY